MNIQLLWRNEGIYHICPGTGKSESINVTGDEEMSCVIDGSWEGQQDQGVTTSPLNPRAEQIQMETLKVE